MKNVLIIGKTGSGKSTLANVVTGTSKFKEGLYSTSETKETQEEEIEIEGFRYKVIDTIGIGDTELTEEGLFNRLQEIIQKIRQNADQNLLFFLTGNGKFTEEEIKAYSLLEKAGITECTTIVRTHFPRFKNPGKCEEDKKAMIKINREFGKVIEECAGVVFVNNPSLNVDDGIEKLENSRNRSHSRKKLMEHLKTISQNEEKEKKQLSEKKEEFRVGVNPKS